MSNAFLEPILKELRNEFSKVLGNKFQEIILYGSYARKDASPSSDVDILVIISGPFDYGELIDKTSAAVASISLENNIAISRVFVSQEQFQNDRTPFLMNVRREGIPV